MIVCNTLTRCSHERAAREARARRRRRVECGTGRADTTIPVARASGCPASLYMAECAVHPQPVLSWSIPRGSTRRPSRSASPAGAPTSKHVLPKCRLALISCFASAARSSGQLVARDADRGRPLDNERTGGCSVPVRLRVRRPSSSELELVAPLTSFASFATWPTSPRLGRLKRAPGLRVELCSTKCCRDTARTTCSL